MNRLFRCFALALMGVAYLGFVGCDTSNKPTPKVSKHDDHDHEHGHEEHPDTYAEAVRKIDELRLIVKDALAKDDTKTADKPLHDLGNLLRHDKMDDVEKLAKKASFDQAALDEIHEAVDELLDSFTAIDDKVHGKKGATYEEKSEQIDAAMATLRQYVPADK